MGCTGQPEQAEEAPPRETNANASIRETNTEESRSPVVEAPERRPERIFPDPELTAAPDLSERVSYFELEPIEPATAHQAYLDDVVEFEDFSVPDWEEDAGVIGSTVAKFYPGASVTDNDSLADLPEGIDIPIGEIVRIFDRLTPPGEPYFAFQGYQNAFYDVEYAGQRGLVFGADIRNRGPKWAHRRIALYSLYYRNDGRFTDFYPIIGDLALEPAVADRLARDRIALQAVRQDEYLLNEDRPDDMVSLYRQVNYQQQTPLFITTDVIAQSLHNFFDKYLRVIEETFFLPRLGYLTGQYISVLNEADAAGAKNVLYARAVALAREYMQVGQALLRMAPAEGEEPLPESVRRAIMSEYPENVRAELELILAEAGVAQSPVTGRSEDYSQFKPRGHYTQNASTEAYFRAMIWFGRMHFGLTPDPADEDAVTRAVTALVISDITRANPELLEVWESIFSPITALIGMSDDLSFQETIPFLSNLTSEELPVWLEDPENLVAAARAAADLRPPQIASSPTLEGAIQKTQPGWRLFGQRFTWDSLIHEFVSTPRIPDRNMVSGLDILAAFGSEAANDILRQTEYSRYDGLEAVLNLAEQGFDELDAGAWDETYYSQTLGMVRSQARFEEGSGFFFTETPVWNIKSLLAAGGTWASLRHDTVLYLKQFYPEGGGDGVDYTYRTEPIPAAVNYIEPNAQFFSSALAAVRIIGWVAASYELDDLLLNSRIRTWETMLARSRDIVTLEFQDRAISAEDNEWIRTIPAILAELIRPISAEEMADYYGGDQYRGAVVADVYSNPQTGQVLEVATGIPHRIYVALNDGQGGKRIAIGYGYSYYEFPQPITNRLDTLEWREMAYDSDEGVERYRPQWVGDYILPPRPE